MVAFPADNYGNLIPVLGAKYGSSLEQAVTTSTGAVMAINASGVAGIIRIFGLGCDVFYITGGSDIALPTLADGLVLSGTYLDVPIPSGHTHVRCAARSGSGTARAELLG